MISSSEMAVVDSNAEALGVARKQLMESAGNAIGRAVREASTPGASVTMVCGRGNNGGDAFAAARFLSDFDVTVLLLGRAETITTEIARENWHALERAEINAREVRDSTALALEDPDVVIDAMLGTGVTGALREPAATAAAAINATDATVISVDVPSGIDADTGERSGIVVETDRVVTFHDQKPGLRDVEADVMVADIGIPDAAERFVERGDLLRLSRDPTAHKGDFGRVLVIGGGPYTGAPTLAARAALRAGADLAHVACPESIAHEIQGYSENVIVRPQSGSRLTPDDVSELLELATEMDCVVVGPGLGDANRTLEAVSMFLAEFEGMAVVDADALQVVPDVDTDATLICTPHQGELEAMGGETATDPETHASLVASFAADLGVTLLVKGAHDVIADGHRTRRNRTGNPGMTVGGTGDVLAGATGAIACVLDPHPAASVAAHANGRAGDIVVEKRGHGLVATDLLESLPNALWPDRPL
jgi:NAD(P)H-hydrate epimerase